MATYRDLVTNAYLELNALGAGQALEGHDLTFGLSKLNRLIDSFNAERQGVFANVISEFTLTPSLHPHTIGPTSATWTVTPARPATIDGARLVISGISQPIHVRDKQWWLHQTQKTLTSAQPSDVYYDDAWPLGRLYFWPVPTSAYTVELLMRVLLASVTAETVIALPNGYEDMLTLTLAEQLVPPLPAPPEMAELKERARKARARVYGNNDEIPRLTTAGSGAPGGAGGFWDYHSGRTI